MKHNTPYIVGVGGANMDISAAVYRAVVMHDSNPGRISTSAGGVTRNILENLSRQGVPCKIMAPVGKDTFGDGIIKACKSVGIDTDYMYVSPDMPSSCYLSFLDETGDMFVASSDMDILDTVPLSYYEEHKGIIQNAEIIVCDTNLTEQQLKKLVEISKGKKLFIDPVSTVKAAKIKDMVGDFYLIKPNKIELELLSGKPCTTNEEIQEAVQVLLDKGTFSVVVSLGTQGCYYADRTGNRIFRSLSQILPMVNATGAGDAFMSGLIHGTFENMELKDMLDYALSCGAIAVQSENTINPNMTDASVHEMIETYGRKE